MASILILSDKGSLSREDEHLFFMTHDMKRTRILPF